MRSSYFKTSPCLHSRIQTGTRRHGDRGDDSDPTSDHEWSCNFVTKESQRRIFITKGNSVLRNTMPLGLGQGAWRKRNKKIERRWQETDSKQEMKERIKG